jgi:hypothetical protein
MEHTLRSSTKYKELAPISTFFMKPEFMEQDVFRSIILNRN